MQRLAVPTATAVLLAGPGVLAFYAGGYFDRPRAIGAACAWGLVLLLALAGPLPLPASRPGRIALAGLVGLAVWTAVSFAWAPLNGPAFDSVQRLVFYIGVLLAAVAVLRDRRAARAVEPVLALGALVAIGYGLVGRLVPGIVDLIEDRSYGAGGRLEQPLTYWNAEGLLAVIGLLLCVRIAGDRSRAEAMRLAAAMACAPLGMGVYLSYSRGALAVTALGLIVLLAVAPTWPQLRAAVTGLVAGAVAAACASALPGVASLTGTASEQQRDGAIMLAILVAVIAATALFAARGLRAERGATARRESASPTAARFASVSSVRYEYWRVGIKAFWREPVTGLGAGGFRVEWRKERRVPSAVTEVHSLPLEMAAELGIPGLALLALFLGGIAAAGRRAVRLGAPLAPAACAVCTAWVLHATIDWDWQLPAVTLPALILAAGLLAAGEAGSPRAAPADWVSEPGRAEPATVGAR